MNFPLLSSISPVPYGPKNLGVTLRINGVAGDIPPTFQYSVITADGNNCDTNTVAMTQDQWSAWSDQNDAEYILDVVATNLGLTREKA